VRGGLAGWQQRIVSTYIDEHLAEQVPLATLTQLVGRSEPALFLSGLQASFGLPPRW
jgi:AraC family transcriptional regulator